MFWSSISEVMKQNISEHTKKLQKAVENQLRLPTVVAVTDIKCLNGLLIMIARVVGI